MDFALSAHQESIRDAVGKICARFDDAYGRLWEIFRHELHIGRPSEHS